MIDTGSKFTCLQGQICDDDQRLQPLPLYGGKRRRHAGSGLDPRLLPLIYKADCFVAALPRNDE